LNEDGRRPEIGKNPWRGEFVANGVASSPALI
jgi:hypothetical protein